MDVIVLGYVLVLVSNFGSSEISVFEVLLGFS